MASTSRTILPSTSSTSDAWVFSTGSPYVRIVYDISCQATRPDVSTPSQYFDDHPTVPSDPVMVDVTLPDTAFVMETDRGVFSPWPPRHRARRCCCAPTCRSHRRATCSTSAAAPARLRSRWHDAPPTPRSGLSTSNARASRALRPQRRTQRTRPTSGSASPDDVPPDVRFATIWSNPPIRIGKAALHDLLEFWLGTPRRPAAARRWSSRSTSAPTRCSAG